MHSYGLSLVLPSTKIAALLMLVDRKLKTIFLSGLCGRFVIIARDSHHSKASEQ